MVELIGKPRQIDERNRVTLPGKLMKLLNLKQKDEIYFSIEGGKIIVGKALVKYDFIDEITKYKKY